MMSGVKGAVLLLLLAVTGSDAAPSAEECAGLTKRLPTKDLEKIFGEWVLAWSVSNHEKGHGLLSQLSSSHVEFKLLPDNKTIEYNERNRFSPESCTIYFSNMTVPSDNSTEHHTLPCDFIRVEKDGVDQKYNDTGYVDFYETCADCLLMTYKTSLYKYLLSYRREGSHRDVEQMKAAHDDLKKMAECLGYPHDKPYTYDGLADFCHHKSAPEAVAPQFVLSVCIPNRPQCRSVCFPSQGMMSGVKGAVLLLLLAVTGSDAAPSAEECAGLTKRLPTKDLEKIFGEWVLAWSVSNHEKGHGLLSQLSSSHVEFKLRPDNKTIMYNERSRFPPDSCTIYFINMTVPSDNSTEHHTLPCDFIRVEKDGVDQKHNDTGRVDFYETCTDCLLMTYKTSSHKYLLSYRREGSHRDVEQMKAAHDDLKKMAECLGFPHDKPYTYDGLADFCHHKSAPEAVAPQA
ncbi:saxitoxin and tetrodotoxin-binding protein 2-like [Melanotaenia boesemani]|uniref:saxitoxin and tetrodotoxin-binding protein 2-like n=1 Tax=Melanotaenia boesemani TaxID=1250792 RepID=UPI001C03F65B|nr:saxitoxin and tetrodotoxin-binding protein 2-like [Melanotaenia boesemani]